MRFRKMAVSSLLLLLCSGFGCFAQSAKQYYDQNQYTQAIETVLGGKTDLSGISDRDLRVLGFSFLARADLVQDLDRFKDVDIFMSTLTGEGVSEVLDNLVELLDRVEKAKGNFEE